MSDEPLIFKPTWPYLLTLASTLLIWTALIIEITRVVLVTAYQQPDLWIALSCVFIATPIIPLWIIARSLKRSVGYNDVTWDFKKRDVSSSEYEVMMHDYSEGYSMVLHKIPLFTIILSIVFAFVAVFHLYIIVALDELLLAFLPYSFGFLLLLYGIFLTLSIYSVTPTDPGIHFPYTHPRVLKDAIRTFEQVLGISWTGIQITMGEAGGYYTIRSPRIIARIEEIESAIEIIGDVDEQGRLTRISARFDSVESPDSEITSKDYTLPDDIFDVVKESVKSYIRTSGYNELLEELVEELGISDVVNAKSETDSPDKFQ
ncbi:MAG: hypothetical protein ACTSUB_03310 [Candidatus Thorarchaeota archaeon]